MTKYNILKLFESYISNIYLVTFSFSISFLLSWLVRLPVNNSENISNQYLSGGYSPEENFIKILFIIIIGILIYLGLKKLQNYDKYFRLFVIVVLVFGLFSIILMPKVVSYFGHIDKFHHGEQLSPANAFLNGKKLYTELFVLHGAGEDVLMPSLGLKLPFTNNSGGIGSYFFLVTTLQVVCAFIFFCLISRLFKNTVIFLLVSSWFLFSFYSDFFYVRDIAVWTVLILLAYLLLNDKNNLNRILLVILGFIGSETYFYAIDRGYILTFIAMLTSIILLILIKSKNSWKFKITFSLQRLKPILYILFGAILAQIIGLLILGSASYFEFIKTSFLTIPKYLGFMFNYPLPDINTNTYLTWLPVFIAIVTSIMLFTLLSHQFKKHKAFESSALYALIIFITSVIFLRTGYGRPDFGHIAYATPLLFLSCFYICYLTFKTFYGKYNQALWPIILVTILVFWPISTLSIDRFISFTNMRVGFVKQYLKLPFYENKVWLPDDINEVSTYIKDNSTDQDYIFSFTQQPIYYYLTDRKNPTRFNISWFADPQNLTEEMLLDLKKNPPKYIIYSSGSGWDNPDGFTSAQRLPEVDAWIKQNYPIEKNIGPIMLLEK